MIFTMDCMTFTKVNTTKKIDRLSAKNKKTFDYKKLRLSDNYLYSSEEEQEKQDEKTTDLDEFNEQVNMKEPDINKEIFKNYFFFQTPSELLKNLCKTNVINSGLEGLKKKINNISENQRDIENQKRQGLKIFNTKTNA